MKKLVFIILCIIGLSFSSFAQNTKQDRTERNLIEIPFVEYLLVVVVSVSCSFGVVFLYNRFTLRNKIVKITLESKRIKGFIASLSNGNDSSSKGNLGSFKNKKPISSNLSNAFQPEGNDGMVQKVIDAIKKEYPNLFKDEEESGKIVSWDIPKVEVVEVPKKRMKFYSVEPRDGASFNGSNFSNEFVPTESVYLIELQNDNIAHFRIIDDNDTMGRAIKYKKELLDVACESLSSSVDTKKIITERPGNAQKDGTKWIIRQKAQIKFK